MAYNGAMDRCDVGGQMVLDTCQGCDIATVHDLLFAKVLTLYSILIIVHIPSPSHATVDIHTLFRFIVIVCQCLAFIAIPYTATSWYLLRSGMRLIFKGPAEGVLSRRSYKSHAIPDRTFMHVRYKPVRAGECRYHATTHPHTASLHLLPTPVGFDAMLNGSWGPSHGGLSPPSEIVSLHVMYLPGSPGHIALGYVDIRTSTVTISEFLAGRVLTTTFPITSSPVLCDHRGWRWYMGRSLQSFTVQDAAKHRAALASRLPRDGCDDEVVCKDYVAYAAYYCGDFVQDFYSHAPCAGIVAYSALRGHPQILRSTPAPPLLALDGCVVHPLLVEQQVKWASYAQYWENMASSRSRDQNSFHDDEVTVLHQVVMAQHDQLRQYEDEIRRLTSLPGSTSDPQSQDVPPRTTDPPLEPVAVSCLRVIDRLTDYVHSLKQKVVDLQQAHDSAQRDLKQRCRSLQQSNDQLRANTIAQRTHTMQRVQDIDRLVAEATSLRQQMQSLRCEHADTVTRLKQSRASLRHSNDHLRASVRMQRSQLARQREQHLIAKSDSESAHRRAKSDIRHHHAKVVASLTHEHEQFVSSLRAQHDREVHRLCETASIRDIQQALHDSRLDEQSTERFVQAFTHMESTHAFSQHLLDSGTDPWSVFCTDYCNRIRRKIAWAGASVRMRARSANTSHGQDSSSDKGSITSHMDQPDTTSLDEPSNAFADALYFDDSDRTTCAVCGTAGRGGVVMTCRHELCETCTRHMVFTSGTLCLQCPVCRVQHNMHLVPCIQDFLPGPQLVQCRIDERDAEQYVELLQDLTSCDHTTLDVASLLHDGMQRLETCRTVTRDIEQSDRAYGMLHGSHDTTHVLACCTQDACTCDRAHHARPVAYPSLRPLFDALSLPSSSVGSGSNVYGMGMDTSEGHAVLGLIGPPLHHKMLATYELSSPLSFPTSSGMLTVSAAGLLGLQDGTRFAGFIHSSSDISVLNVGHHVRYMGWAYAQSERAVLITRPSHDAPGLRHELHFDEAVGVHYLSAASFVGPDEDVSSKDTSCLFAEELNHDSLLASLVWQYTTALTLDSGVVPAPRIPPLHDVVNNDDMPPSPSQHDMQQYVDASRMGERLDATVAQWVCTNLFQLDSYLTFTEIGRSHMHLIHYLFDACVTVVGGAGTFTVRQMGLMRHTNGSYMLCVIKPQQAHSILSTSSYCTATCAAVAIVPPEPHSTHNRPARCVLILPDAVCTPLAFDDHTVHYMDVSSFNTPMGHVNDAYSALYDAAARLASLQISVQSVLDTRGLVCNPHHRHFDHFLHEFIKARTHHTSANVLHMFSEELRVTFTNSTVNTEPLMAIQGSVHPPGMDNEDVAQACFDRSDYARLPVSFPIQNPINPTKEHGGAWTIEAIYKGKVRGRGFIIALLDDSGAPNQIVHCPLSMIQHTTQCQNAIMLSPAETFKSMSQQWWQTHGQQSFAALDADGTSNPSVRNGVLSLLRALDKHHEGCCLMLHDYVGDGGSDYCALASPSAHNSQISPSLALDVDTSVIHECVVHSQAIQQWCMHTVDAHALTPSSIIADDFTEGDEIPRSPVKEPRYAPRVHRPDMAALTLLQAVALNASYCGSCISTTARMTNEQVGKLAPIEHLVMSFHFQTSVATHAFKDTCVYEYMAKTDIKYTASDVLNSSGILQSAAMPHALCTNGDALWKQEELRIQTAIDTAKCQRRRLTALFQYLVALQHTEDIGVYIEDNGHVSYVMANAVADTCTDIVDRIHEALSSFLAESRVILQMARIPTAHHVLSDVDGIHRAIQDLGDKVATTTQQMEATTAAQHQQTTNDMAALRSRLQSTESELQRRLTHLESSSAPGTDALVKAIIPAVSQAFTPVLRSFDKQEREHARKHQSDIFVKAIAFFAKYDAMMHRVVGASSHVDTRTVAREFHALVKAEHPASTAATAEGRASTIQSITYMFDQMSSNHTEFRLRDVGSTFKTAHLALHKAWQDTVVIGVRRYAGGHGLVFDDHETWLSYCMTVCSTWSCMMLTLGAGLGLPIEQFKDFAHLALPQSLMDKWAQSWMTPIPDRQVPPIIRDILDRYIDTITVALVDMWEHVSMGSPGMEPYQGNTLYDLVAPIVHDTQRQMALLHSQGIGSADRAALEQKTSKAAITKECRDAVVGSSTAMSWFLGNFYQVYRNKRTAATMGDKYVVAARDNGALLHQVWMLLGEPIRTATRMDDDFKHMEITLTVQTEYHTAHTKDKNHPAPYSPAAQNEIKRRMQQYRHSDTDDVVSTMELLDEYRQRRLKEEQADNATSNMKGQRVRTPPSITMYDMVDPLADVVRRSSLFIAGCSLPSCDRSTPNSTVGRSRRIQRKTLALPAPQANSVVSDSKPSASPTAPGMNADPTCMHYSQQPSTHSQPPAAAPTTRAYLQPPPSSLPTSCMQSPSPPPPTPPPTSTQSEAAPPPTVAVIEDDDQPMWDEYDHPHPSFIERVYSCAAEGEYLVTSTTPSSGSCDGPSVCTVDSSHVDPKIQQHAKYIRDNAARYMGMNYWSQLCNPENSADIIGRILDGGIDQWWKHLPRLCHCRVSPSLHSPCACYNSHVDLSRTLYGKQFLQQMRDITFLRKTCEGGPVPDSKSECIKRCFQPEQMGKVRAELDKKAKRQRSTVTDADVLDFATCRCRRCYSMIEQHMNETLVPAVVRSLQQEPVGLPNSPGTCLSPQDTDQLLAMVFAHQLRRAVRQRTNDLKQAVNSSDGALHAVEAYLANLQVIDREAYVPTYHHIGAHIDLKGCLGDHVCTLQAEDLLRPCPYLGKDVEDAVHDCLVVMFETIENEKA